MKIVIINHTFQLPRFYKRWQLLAETHANWEVILIAPSKFKWDTRHSLIFGNNIKSEGFSMESGNFRIIAVPIIDLKIGWVSRKMVQVIKDIKPDIIYHIGGHTQLSLVQCAKLVKKTLKETKLIAFSMRGPAMNIKKPVLNNIVRLLQWGLSFASYLLRKHNLKYFNKYSDAVVCHYPDAIECFREEGYSGPIYMSTQVGVDPDVFHPDKNYRNEIREKYNLYSSFVFGCAVRFLPMKGLYEIIEALPVDGDWKLLIMGTGDHEFIDSLNKRIKERGIQNKIIFTGYIQGDEMAKYWNAIDCSLHVPRTTEKWEETFSLAVVQAMATGKAVIGNTSGSVPYQLGPNGIIVKEGDIEELREKINWAVKHPKEIENIGQKMMEYALNSFSIYHLNKHIAAIFEDVKSGHYSEQLMDMAKFN